MQEFRGLTAEIYQAIVAIVDDRLREVRVTREGFEQLTQAVTALTEAQGRTEARVEELAQAQGRTEARVEELAQAQGRTEARVEELAQAQARTEARIEELAQAQVRTEARVEELAQAQARTEARVGQLEVRMDRVEAALERLAEAQARTEERVGQLEVRMDRVEAALERLAQAQARTETALQQLSRQVGGLSETVGGDIEDIAYIVLYDALKREFGWEVGVLERTWEQWNGEAEEINIFGQATDPARPTQTIWIVGEAKHNLTLREVDQFARQADRARRYLPGEVYAVCFAYRARPEVRARLQELQIPLLFSYGRFAG